MNSLLNFSLYYSLYFFFVIFIFEIFVQIFFKHCSPSLRFEFIFGSFGFYHFHADAVFSIQFDTRFRGEDQNLKMAWQRNKGKLCVAWKMNMLKEERAAQWSHGNCPPGCPTHAAFNTKWIWHKCINFETKSQKATMKNVEKHFSIQLIRTHSVSVSSLSLALGHLFEICNATLICMRKWSVQRAWNIKVHDTKQTLKTYTQLCIYKSCWRWHSQPFSFAILFLHIDLCVRCVSMHLNM